jgi:hypothetical protein
MCSVDRVDSQTKNDEHFPTRCFRSVWSRVDVNNLRLRVVGLGVSWAVLARHHPTRSIIASCVSTEVFRGIGTHPPRSHSGAITTTYSFR